MQGKRVLNGINMIIPREDTNHRVSSLSGFGWERWEKPVVLKVFPSTKVGTKALWFNSLLAKSSGKCHFHQFP